MPDTFLDQISQSKKAKDGRVKAESALAKARRLAEKEARAKIIYERRMAELRNMGFEEDDGAACIDADSLE